MSRTTNIARENGKIVEAGGYVNLKGEFVELEQALHACFEQTQLYTPAMVPSLLPESGPGSALGAMPTIEVSTEKSGAAGCRVALEGAGNPLLLNFASARNPGGGYLRGAKAQEEDLARASALYYSQLRQPEYYAYNRCQASLLYSDHLIYSPKVPFFRDERYELLDQAIQISVVTAPAPNAGEVRRGQPEDVGLIEGVLRQRARLVLAVARAHGHRELVLGAWGCGVFRNDPAMVASAFADALESAEFAGAFDRAVFPLYERNRERPVLRAFQRRFGVDDSAE